VRGVQPRRASRWGGAWGRSAGRGSERRGAWGGGARSAPPSRIRCITRRSLGQTELAGARDSLGAPLDLEFAEDLAIVSFDRVQGEKQPLPNLLIGEPLRNEAEDFQLAAAQWLDQRPGGLAKESVFTRRLPSIEHRQRSGGGSFGQMHSGLAHRELVRLSQMSRRR